MNGNEKIWNIWMETPIAEFLITHSGMDLKKTFKTVLEENKKFQKLDELNKAKLIERLFMFAISTNVVKVCSKCNNTVETSNARRHRMVWYCKKCLPKEPRDTEAWKEEQRKKAVELERRRKSENRQRARQVTVRGKK